MASAEAATGEHVVNVSNEHWIQFVVPVLICSFLFGISLLLFVLAGLAAHHYTWLTYAAYIAALCLLLITLHWFFMMLLSESLSKIIITNRRLLRVQYRLILHEDILEISFEKMKTVDAQKEGLLQNLLHYGTIYFETKLAAIRFVPHPNRIAHIIQEAMQKKV